MSILWKKALRNPRLYVALPLTILLYIPAYLVVLCGLMAIGIKKVGEELDKFCRLMDFKYRDFLRDHVKNQLMSWTWPKEK